MTVSVDLPVPQPQPQPRPAVEPSQPPAEPSSGLLAKAARGAAALSLRQIAVTGLNVLGAVALARLVAPSVFGVYAIAAFVVGFLNFFAEAGLGASLIRQPEPPAQRELEGAFTLQLTLALVVVGLGWVAAPHIAHAVHAVPHTTMLIRLGLCSLVVAAANLVPGAMLERELRFSRLGLVNVGQALVFNGIAVGCAAAGAPVIGVGVAMLTQAVVGAALLARAHPWRPGLALRATGLRERLSFSVPLQASSILSSLKDAIAPLFVGGLLGARSVGLVEWSISFAAYPVLALMAFQQVYLPTFSRLQHDVAALGRAVERVLLGTNLVVAPLAVLTLALADPMTRVIFGTKWLVALPTFRLFWIGNVFVASASPLMSLLYARGRSRTALMMTVVWMVGTWAFGAPLIAAFGMVGYGVANVLVQLTNVLLFRAARKQAPFRILAPAWRPWAVAAAVGALVYLLSRSVPTGIATLCGEWAAGLAVYGAVMWRFETAVLAQLRAALRGRA